MLELKTHLPVLWREEPGSSEAGDSRIPAVRRPIGAQDATKQTPSSSPQDEAPAGPRPLRAWEPHWPAFRPPSLSIPGIWLGRRAFSFPALIGRILMMVRGSRSLYWFSVFRMGGERQNDTAQGDKRGVRRRVVGDAGPRLLLGNLLLSPRPLRAFCPINCRSGWGSSAGRHAGALQGEAGVPGGRSLMGGAGTGRVQGAGASLAFWAAPLGPAEPVSSRSCL